MTATTPTREKGARAPAPAMKWWGWGDPGVAFTHEDKPGLAPFIREVLGIDVTRSGSALPGFEGRTPEPARYDDETDEARLARRSARWTPTVLVEAQPSI